MELIVTIIMVQSAMRYLAVIEGVSYGLTLLSVSDIPPKPIQAQVRLLNHPLMLFSLIKCRFQYFALMNCSTYFLMGYNWEVFGYYQ
jgi:hypothetical protein